jgi:hypothetical protein
MNRVTLYSKPSCHLCDVAKAVIARVAQVHALELEVRNIEADPADFERYQYDIPVIAVNGREIARHRLSEAVLIAALQESHG